MITKFLTVWKTVKLRILNSVATLEVHKSDSGMKTTCYKYKKDTIKVVLKWFVTTRTPTATPCITIFTLSRLKVIAFFKKEKRPQGSYPNFSKMKKDINKRFHHCKLHKKKTQVWHMSNIGFKKDSEKLLQTKCAMQKTVQLKIILIERRIKKSSQQSEMEDFQMQ